MRSDFAKILVERPRLRGGWLRKGRGPRDGQHWPKRQGLRRAVVERGEDKSLNENLGPLRRYLDKQVGRPWNKIYREIRAQIRPGHTVQEHILVHVFEYVSRDVLKTAPTVAAPCGLKSNPGRGHGGGAPLRPGDLYIDPDTGLLRKARRRLKGPHG